MPRSRIWSRRTNYSNAYGGPPAIYVIRRSMSSGDLCHPAIYVIDRQGIIRFASTNMVSYAQLAKAVESAALAS